MKKFIALVVTWTILRNLFQKIAGTGPPDIEI